MGDLTQTTAQVQTDLDAVEASNAGLASISDLSDTTATAAKKSGFHALQASSSNAPSTDRAVLISAVRNTSASSQIRYGQVAITESNGLWWNSDNNGTLGTWSQAATLNTAQTISGAKSITGNMTFNSATLDLNGNELILDADGDTSIHADTDDQFDVKIAGADDFQFTANTFTALSGSTIKANTIAETTAASGVTIDGVLLKDSTSKTGTLTVGSGSITDSSGTISLGSTNLTLGSGDLTVSAGGLTLSAGAATIRSGQQTLVLGADSNTTTFTDATDKLSRIGAAHYTNAEEPSTVIYTANTSSGNVVRIGGGTSTMNAATSVEIWTATNNTTTTGSQRAVFSASGDLTLTTGDLNLTTGDLTVSAGDVIITTPTTPASAGATGTVGTIAWDSDYMYVCVATNTWKRAALSTW